MRYLPLVWAGLWRKRARTILTSLSVATAFLLYGGLQGTMTTIDVILETFGDESELWTMSRVNLGEALPLAHLSRIERVDGVKNVEFSQGFGGYYRDPENRIGGNAIDIGRLLDNPDPNLIVPAAYIETMQRMRTGTIIGKKVSERFGLSIGDRLPLRSGWTRKDRSNDWVFDIVGIYEVPDDAGYEADRILINYDYFDEARAIGTGTVSVFKSQVVDVEQAARVAADIDRLFANSADATLTQSLADAIRTEIDQIADIQLVINVILSAVLFALLFVTGNAMMQSFRERIPELAVLKTYGYSDAVVTGLVSAEAGLLCVTSALIGMAVASALFPMIFMAFELEPQLIEPRVIYIGAAIAVALALASVLPPAWRARQLNIVDALAGR